MKSLEQERAKLAHEHVSKIAASDVGDQKKYSTMVHRFPALLSSAGLCQALHFVEARQKKLLDHLAAQLRRVDSDITGADKLLDVVRKATLPSYLHLTHEALECASWYRRMVQGVLKQEAGDDE